MERSFSELMDARALALDTQRGITDEASREQWATQENALYDMLMGLSLPGRAVPLKEAMTSRDFPTLLKTVTDERIMMPIEPEYIGQALLAQTIAVGRRYGQYRVPVFGFMEAQEVAEGMEAPEAFAEINKDNITTIPIKKFAIRVAATDEVLQADEMGLFGMYLIAAKLAMRRKKEEQIFGLFKSITLPVFDNVQAWGSDYLTTTDLSTINTGSPFDAKFATQGRGQDGNLNGTLHIFDVVDAIAACMVRGYVPTEMLVNPMAWAIFARNPILNGFYNNQRALPAQAMQAPQYQGKGPDAIASTPMPWAMTMHVTPFVPVNFTDTGDAPFVTDIYLGSRQNGVIVLQGEALQQDSYDDKARDILNIRLKEYYGVGLADMGRSWASIKNIRIDSSYEYVTTKLVG